MFGQQRRGGEVQPHAFRHHRGIGSLAAGQDEQELLAAVAADEIAIAEAGLHAAGRLLEHRVPGRMAVGVVDALEVVDVGDRDRHRTVSTPCSPDLATQLLEDGAAVPQTRQVVMGRLDLKGLLRAEQIALQVEDAFTGAQADLQLESVEGLGQEVVGARLETRQHVFSAGFRGQEDEIHVGRGLLADDAANLQAVEIRHHPVENRELRRVGRQQGRGRLPSGAHGENVVPHAREGALQQSSGNRLVVCDQDLHCETPFVPYVARET